ncbi:LPS export ABC transporter periplasmic protein LptC [Tropicimonas marinistellae]|uniref:LPS export ABC transporter periplasmic protein LptC n=1 Tax=Tropicimonas marinistellae TaxID=1739787 RepID=UPI00082DC631|nr:LPS export ABC transporter periplasmic protein LptC [Tropicimonas marinistellae]
MAARDNLHSHVVAWLKVILPLAALALLSTLFLVARTGDPDATLPFSEKDLEEMASEQRVEGPEFAGLTEDGRAINLSAETATPRDSKASVVDAVQVRGRFETGDDGTITMRADAGTVYSDESQAHLHGNVRVATSTGFTIDTEQLRAALDRTDMEAPGVVTAEGPLGRIDAGRMEVTQEGSDRGDVRVVFKDGVKLIYVPQNQ